MMKVNNKKSADSIVIRSQAHHKPNIHETLSALIRSNSMYILLLVLFRGGDSRAIEQNMIDSLVFKPINRKFIIFL